MTTRILERPTLTLNGNWQPVNVATMARALVLLWNESARVVDSADYQLYTWADWTKLAPKAGEAFIRGVRLCLRVPEVVALTEYDRLPVAHVTFSRRNIFKRDHYTCQYCGRQGRSQLRAPVCAFGTSSTRLEAHEEIRPRRQPGSEELTVDHVLPRAQGGVSSWENCVLACVACNKRKADRTPEQARMKLRKQPVRPAWKPPGTEGHHAQHGRVGRRSTRCGSPVGRSSSVRRTGAWSWGSSCYADGARS